MGAIFLMRVEIFWFIAAFFASLSGLLNFSPPNLRSSLSRTVIRSVSQWSVASTRKRPSKRYAPVKASRNNDFSDSRELTSADRIRSLPCGTCGLPLDVSFLTLVVALLNPGASRRLLVIASRLLLAIATSLLLASVFLTTLCLLMINAAIGLCGRWRGVAAARGNLVVVGCRSHCRYINCYRQVCV